MSGRTGLALIQHVGAAAAVENVTATFPEQLVVAALAVENVVPGGAATESKAAPASWK